MANWKGVNYSDNDVLTMQQEAIRRVRQMQSRSAQNLMAQADAAPLPQAADIPQVPSASHIAASVAPAPAREAPAHQNDHFSSAAGQGHQGGAQSGHASQGGGVSSILSQLGSNFNLSSIADRLGIGRGSHEGDSSPTQEKGIGNLLSSIVGEESPIGKVLAALNIDNERLILIGLLLVLMNEKADWTLLIALFYLLL